MDDTKTIADMSSEDRTAIVRLARTLNVDENALIVTISNLDLSISQVNFNANALAKELAKFAESVKLPTKSEKSPIPLNRAERRRLKKSKKNA